QATRGGDPSRAEGCSGYTAYPHWPGGLVRCVAPRRILMTAHFGRLMTAMVSPFTADSEVDLEQTKMLARALVASGTEGIVSTGSTGEAPALDEAETVAVWRATKEAVGPGVAVIAGATNNDTRRSIRLTEAAEREGMDGVLLTVPAYNRPTQDGLVAHFRSIARSTSLPCLLY